MSEITVINKNEPVDASESYAFLRQEGLKYIQTLAGEIWTDYNTHDPGITIMELLCYAISDLGKRASSQIADIVVDPDTGLPQDNQFYKAADILTNSPLTKNDYRKLLSDIDGVKNVYLFASSDLKERSSSYSNLSQPYKVDYDLHKLKAWYPDFDPNPTNSIQYVSGLYNIIIELDEELYHSAEDNDTIKQKKDEKRFAALGQVLITYFKTRNLCEDIHKLGFLSYSDERDNGGIPSRNYIPIELERIDVKANIEIDQNANNEEVLAEIYYRIAKYIAPPVEFSSLESLLNNGQKIDEIIQGPLLKHGFVNDEYLNKLVPKTILYSSDIINEIMDIEGVVDVKSLALKSNLSTEPFQPWKLDLQNGKIPGKYFQPVLGFFLNGLKPNDIKLTKGLVRVQPNLTEVKQRITELRINRGKQSVINTTSSLDIPIGENQEFEAYYPIQNELPLTYGTGLDGLPSSTENLTEDQRKLRTAQSLQLKAYLLFYEQVLVNYLAQLNGVKHLLSWNPITENDQTYFSGLLSESDIREYELLFDGDAPTFEQLHYLAEDSATYLDRKNRFLNHLMSRFNEEMEQYSFLMLAKNKGLELAKDKVNFLKDYPLISGERAKGFSYFFSDQSNSLNWGTDNISGFQRRIARLMGIDDPRIRSVAYPTSIEEEAPNEWRFYVDVAYDSTDQSAKTRFIGPITSTEKRASEELDHFLWLVTSQNPTYEPFGDTPNNYGFKILLDKVQILNPNDDRYVESKTFSSESERDLISNKVAKYLSNYDGEGLHVMDHILLRPQIPDQWRTTVKVPHSGAVITSDFFLYSNNYDTYTETEEEYLDFLADIKKTSTVFEATDNGSGIYYLGIRKTIPATPPLPITYVYIGSSEFFDSKEKADAAAIVAKNYLTPSSTPVGTVEVIPNANFLNIGHGPGREFISPYDIDPYSFNVTVVLPAWPAKFRDPFFRKYAEDMMSSEVPAHIAVNYKWVSNTQLQQFEACYKDYLDRMSKGQEVFSPYTTCLVDTLNGLIDVYETTYIIQPPENEDYFINTPPPSGPEYVLAEVNNPNGSPIINAEIVNVTPDAGSKFRNPSNLSFPVNYNIAAGTPDNGTGKWIKFDTVTGKFTIGNRALVTAGSWLVDVDTTDELGFQVQHRIRLIINKDIEAIPTLLIKPVTHYVEGDILLTFDDNDVTDNNLDIVSADFSGSIPLGTEQNLPNPGDLRIKAGQLTTFVNDVNAKDGKFQFQVLTVDKVGGRTTSYINMVIPRVRPAVYTVNPGKSDTAYKKWDVLATVVDPDGAIVNADFIAPSSAPPGTQLITNQTVASALRTQYLGVPGNTPAQANIIFKIGNIIVIDTTQFLYNLSPGQTGVWPLVIKTTDQYNVGTSGQTTHNISIQIYRYVAAVYTTLPFRSVKCYDWGDTLATVAVPPTNSGRTIKSAVFEDVENFPIPPNISINSVNGTISVSEKLFELDVAVSGNLLQSKALKKDLESKLNEMSNDKPLFNINPIMYTIKVMTVDSRDAVTHHTIVLDFTDKLAYFHLNQVKLYTAYATSDVLGSIAVNPVHETFTSIELFVEPFFGPLPEGISINIPTGSFYVSDAPALKAMIRAIFLDRSTLTSGAYSEYAYNTTISLDMKTITFRCAFRTIDECGVITELVDVNLIFQNDTPSVSSGLSSLTSMEQNDTFSPNPTVIYTQDYQTLGKKIVQFADADNGSNNFKNITLVSGDFFGDKAEIQTSTGRIIVKGE